MVSGKNCLPDQRTDEMQTFQQPVFRAAWSAIALPAAAVVACLAVQGCVLTGAGSGSASEEYSSSVADSKIPLPEPPFDIVAADVLPAGPEVADVSSDEGAGSGDSGLPDSDHLPTSKRNSTAPVLKSGYRISVSVMAGESEELPPTEVVVSEDGNITLPLVGKVECDGLTLSALRSVLTSRFGEQIRNPDVTVKFVISSDPLAPYPYGQVLVQGRVVNEGWVRIPETRELRLSRAIQLAGGFDTSARKSSVRVTRKDENGKPIRMKVDIDAIGKRGELDKDVMLEPDDVIYVFESNF